MILMKNYSDNPTSGENGIPINIQNLYKDAVEEKNFTRVKVDLFANTIRKNI